MKGKVTKSKSIFRALFVPLFIIMIMQACIFYIVAIHGGIKQILAKNAIQILEERVMNRKNEIETLYNKSWTDLENCENQIDTIYEKYCRRYGSKPLTKSKSKRNKFLGESLDILIATLRKNSVNGVFLIINDIDKECKFNKNGEQKAGICIRDLDQTSDYTGVEDLLLERAPVMVVEKNKCSLDSWWEPTYTFSSEKKGDYYYEPIKAAWDNPGTDGEDIAYFAGGHQISKSDRPVVSYSMPLIDAEGFPYAVVGVELTTDYLSTLMPEQGLTKSNNGCYILGMKNINNAVFTPIAEAGAIFRRCFDAKSDIKLHYKRDEDGFNVVGRDGTEFYGTMSAISIYNNNNPFEDEQFVLMALIKEKELFSYISKIKIALAVVSLVSLAMGLVGIGFVSRKFAHPITELAGRVKKMKPQNGFSLGRLGIYEIDQLVAAIEELNRTASRDTARTEFFSRMSHDMRTPMNAIISFSSPELLEGADEKTKEDYFGKIHSSGEYLLGLINEVLDMTKIESNKIDIVCSPKESSKIWDTIITIIDKVAQKKGVIFKKEINGENYNVLVDEQHLNQVVMNLLSNAVKFTGTGKTVCFKVSTSENMDGNIHFNVVVEDSGIGMSEEFMKKLYSPFVQENESREGTGLGLSIAKKLIEMINGTIQCQSKQGVGTRFTLDFNLEKYKEDIEYISDGKEKRAEMPENISENVKAEDENIAPEKKAKTLEGCHVLVCEDHPLNAQIIMRLLKRVGIEVDVAENGQVGLEKFKEAKENTYDAILMDIRMPIMDGLQATELIRSLERKDAKSIPIIAMTANAFDEDVKASKDAGMNEHLSKPIEPQEVYDTLRELV